MTKSTRRSTLRDYLSECFAASEGDHGILSQLVDPDQIAIAGQSDGAATALATAYDTRCLDRRVDAAIILSGAEIIPGPYFQSRNPPLLATQGTADRVNQPKYTYRFFHAAHTRKFLLKLPRATSVRIRTSNPSSEWWSA